MASRKSFLSRSSYIFPATSETQQEGELEFDEADLWNISNTVTTESKKGIPGLKRGSSSSRVSPVNSSPSSSSSSSLPMNIPDWSKILKEDYKKNSKENSIDKDDDFDCDGGVGVRIPPHEYLARTRGASLSVHEGVGRTLKGRDLRSVRNAIWKKVGFED